MSGRSRGSGSRGAYYKARYGGGGRGRGGDVPELGSTGSQPYREHPSTTGPPKGDWDRLEADLRTIDGQQYGLYKQLLGNYGHAASIPFTLAIDHVQGDAYASPSRVRAIVLWQHSGFPDEYLAAEIRRVALCDFVTRIAGSLIQAKHLDRNTSNANSGWSGAKGGAFSINIPGQEVLPRTSAMITGNDTIELRFTVSLPAAGRTILGQQAHQILAINLVEIVRRSLLYSSVDQDRLREHIASVEAQDSIRAQLRERGLAAFVADGSVLPRLSGASQAPLSGTDVTAFKLPPEFTVTLTASNGRKFTGMGIRRGVTLLTGGGFHGKSTLLEALELGIYNHIPGDGREGVVTDPTAFKIRAEDGRSVSKTDISPFISTLPGGKETSAFSTSDASGSTSMASNIQEALEAGCQTLLIDEDSSATNLLVRDARMQALIPNEPITPLVSKARALYTEQGVSVVIVIGGLGDWLAVADHIICMDSYMPRDIKRNAEEVVRQFPSNIDQDTEYGSIPHRAFRVDLDGLRPPYATGKKFIATRSEVRNAVADPSKADNGIELGGLDQIIEQGQTRTISVLLQRIADLTSDRALTLQQVVEKLAGLVGIDKSLPTSLQGGDLVAVRKFELTAALSRIRGLALRVDQAR